MFVIDGDPIVLYGVYRIKRKYMNHTTPKRAFKCLGYRLCGSSLFECKGQKYMVGEHQCILIGDNVTYSQQSDGEEVIAVHFDTVDGFSPFDGMEVLSPSNAKLADECFCELYSKWEQKKDGYKNECMALIYKIFAMLFSDSSRSDSELSENIKRGVEYIRSHFAEPTLTVVDAARTSMVSEVYFRRVFTAHFGTPPSVYISSLRLEYAAELLSSGYYNVNEAAAHCGFSDSKYFSTCFKKKYGVSPSAYQAHK